MNTKKILVLSIAVCALSVAPVAAQSSGDNKKVTVISGKATADGSSQIVERPLEECIVSLPSVKDLVADVTTASEYLKEIGGDAARSGHTKTYKATVTVNYMVRQKFLLIVTTSSIEGKDPVMQEMERTVMLSKTFASDPGEGNIFAGRSNRKYYYSTPQAASDNAKARAETWIRQQQSVLCTAGGK